MIIEFLVNQEKYHNNKAKHNHTFSIYRDNRVKASRLLNNIREYIREFNEIGMQHAFIRVCRLEILRTHVKSDGAIFKMVSYIMIILWGKHHKKHGKTIGTK